METNLRPMSLGEILDRTAQLYRSNFVLFAGIAAVYAGAMLVLNLAQVGMQEILRAHNMTQQVPWVTLGFIVLILPLMIIFSGAAMAANNRAVAWVNLGEPATIRGAYRSILPRLGRYLWLVTIALFRIYIPFVAIYVVFFAVVLIAVASKSGIAHKTGTTDPYSTIIMGIALIGLVLLSIPAVIYAVWMALRYSLAVPASVVENLKARQALRRSVELTQGSRGRIFILGLLIMVIEMGLVLITQIFFIVVALNAIKNHGQPPVWSQVLQQIVGFFTNSFIGPMYATGLTLFYYDQRIRKEGFDIEWMMQAAGLTTPVLTTPDLPAPASSVASDQAPSAEAEEVPAEPVPEAAPPAEPGPEEAPPVADQGPESPHE